MATIAFELLKEFKSYGPTPLLYPEPRFDDKVPFWDNGKMIRAHKTLALSLALTLIVACGAFFLGLYFGYNKRSDIEKITTLINKEPNVVLAGEQIDFDPFWKAWNLINEKFVTGNGTTTDQERVWGAIEGLVGSLEDPYSVFMPPVDAQIFEENIQGNFGGVGMEIGMRDGVLTVVAPLKGTPAERAGILSGDQIVAIDEKDTAGMNVDEAVKIIRGEIGTPVVFKIARKGVDDFLKKEVVRATITIPTIDTENRDDGIFVIKLYNFSAVSPNLFREGLREFVLSGREKLILDLRGNPGGFLDAAVDIASWFLPAGKIVATEDFGELQNPIIYRSRGYDVFNERLEMVILVDAGSASASEILAGALQEHGRAKLVGEKTFGKGSVQELLKVTPETSLKLTIAQWKTPNGNHISKGGLTPDIEVKRTPDDRTAGKDPQLAKAIELLQSNN